MNIKADDSIILEVTEDWHAPVLLELVNSCRPYLKQWLPWVDYMQTVNDFAAYISSVKKKRAEGSDFSFMIMYNGSAAGRIGIHYIDRQNKCGAIGYWLAEGFTGRGIITKACRALVGYCFTSLGLNRIEIKCATGNAKSQAIAERLGFVKEGVIREGELLHNQFTDLYLFSMLKADWDRASS